MLIRLRIGCWVFIRLFIRHGMLVWDDVARNVVVRHCRFRLVVVVIVDSKRCWLCHHRFFFWRRLVTALTTTKQVAEQEEATADAAKAYDNGERNRWNAHGSILIPCGYGACNCAN